MKKNIIGIFSIVAFSMTLFFNANTICFEDDLSLNDLIVVNTANAEESNGDKYLKKKETTTATTSTYIDNCNVEITQTNSTTVTTCEGTGLTPCTPGTTHSYSSSPEPDNC